MKYTNIRIPKILFALGISATSFCANAQSWISESLVPAELTFPVVVELNGNVHVIGGGGSGGATDLHLRFQPSLNKWDTLAPVPFKAQQPAGAVVNGKIHFCGGGYPNTGSRLNLHYFYNPDSAKWFKAANMPVATAIHKAVEFEGKLYCLSGQPDKLLCEYYDPGSDAWTAKNALPDQNFWYGAVVSNSSAIYRFGGGGYTAPTKAAHRYDKNNDVWDPIAQLPKALHALAATFINDSLIYIAGGYSGGMSQATAYIYNTLQDQYYYSDDLPLGRNYHSLIAIQQCVYSVGGSNTADPDMGKSFIYQCDPSVKGLAGIRKNTNIKPYQIVQTGDKIEITFNAAMPGGYTIELHDMSGRLVRTDHADQVKPTVQFNAAYTAPGNYFVRIYSNNFSHTEQCLLTK